MPDDSRFVRRLIQRLNGGPPHPGDEAGRVFREFRECIERRADVRPRQRRASVAAARGDGAGGRR